MARQAVIGSGGGGIVSKIVSAIVVLGLIYFVVQYPSQAADFTLTLAHWGKAAVEGISEYAHRMASH